MENADERERDDDGAKRPSAQVFHYRFQILPTGLHLTIDSHSSPSGHPPLHSL
jgi:hypothetical protein